MSVLVWPSRNPDATATSAPPVSPATAGSCCVATGTEAHQHIFPVLLVFLGERASHHTLGKVRANGSIICFANRGGAPSAITQAGVRHARFASSLPCPVEREGAQQMKFKPKLWRMNASHFSNCLTLHFSSRVGREGASVLRRGSLRFLKRNTKVR